MKLLLSVTLVGIDWTLKLFSSSINEYLIDVPPISKHNTHFSPIPSINLELFLL